MGWKEFFKLTKGKIILSIVLLIVGFFMFMGAFSCGLGMDTSGICNLLIILVPLAYLFVWPGMLILQSGNNWINSVRPLGQLSPYAKYEIVFQLGAVILNLIWIYIVVCLVYFIIGKIRNRN